MQDTELIRIGEVSKLFHMSVSTLRHYEALGLVVPEKVDAESGYRYYGRRQFEQLNTLSYLRHLDMSLEEIRGYLNHRDPQTLLHLLHEQQSAMEKRAEEIHRAIARMTRRQEQIRDALEKPVDQIVIQEMPEMHLVVYPCQTHPENYLDLELPIRSLVASMHDPAVFLGKIGLMKSKEQLQKGVIAPYERVFLVLEEEDAEVEHRIDIPASLCMTLRFRGSHATADAQYIRMLGEIQKHKFKICGDAREITLIDEGMSSKVSEHVTEIAIPVRRNS